MSKVEQKIPFQTVEPIQFAVLPNLPQVADLPVYENGFHDYQVPSDWPTPQELGEHYSTKIYPKSDGIVSPVSLAPLTNRTIQTSKAEVLGNDKTNYDYRLSLFLQNTDSEKLIAAVNDQQILRVAFSDCLYDEYNLQNEIPMEDWELWRFVRFGVKNGYRLDVPYFQFNTSLVGVDWQLHYLDEGVPIAYETPEVNGYAPIVGHRETWGIHIKGTDITGKVTVASHFLGI